MAHLSLYNDEGSISNIQDASWVCFAHQKHVSPQHTTTSCWVPMRLCRRCDTAEQMGTREPSDLQETRWVENTCRKLRESIGRQSMNLRMKISAISAAFSIELGSVAQVKGDLLMCQSDEGLNAWRRNNSHIIRNLHRDHFPEKFDHIWKAAVAGIQSLQISSHSWRIWMKTMAGKVLKLWCTSYHGPRRIYPENGGWKHI